MFTFSCSKEYMTLSDFPPPKEFPNFLHNSHVYAYHQLYVKNFGLEKHIRFETEILEVKKHSLFKETGQWEVTSRHQGEEKTETFDFVMVCSGHFAEPYNPHFNGEESFTGKMIHSMAYRIPDGYENKKVVVVGMGNFGCDIAAELSYRAKMVKMLPLTFITISIYIIMHHIVSLVNNVMDTS